MDKDKDNGAGTGFYIGALGDKTSTKIEQEKDTIAFDGRPK